MNLIWLILIVCTLCISTLSVKNKPNRQSNFRKRKKLSRKIKKILQGENSIIDTIYVIFTAGTIDITYLALQTTFKIH